MYLTHFGLHQAPFKITPNPDFFYSGSHRGATLEALAYAVSQGDGIIKVTGEVGTGKTMLCRMLHDQLASHIEVIYLINPSLNPEQVIYAIAHELTLDTRTLRFDEVMRLLHTALINRHSAGRQVVLLVEEAQAMPLATLEAIRLLSNLETAEHKLLQIVLFAQPELNTHLDLPVMRQLKERIAHSFTLPPMEKKAIPAYLAFRLHVAGHTGDTLFSPDAIRLLYRLSRGVVRRLNLLADKALLAAFAENASQVQVHHIRAAGQDSEFIYNPIQQAKRNRRIGLGAMLSCLITMAVWPLWSYSGKMDEAMVNRDNLAFANAASNTESGQPASITTLNLVQPSGSLITQRLSVSQRWLATAEPTHFTIQIMVTAMANRSQLEQFLNQSRSEIVFEQLHLYPTQYVNTPQLGVLYGIYASADEAQSALNKLSRQHHVHPVLRTIKNLNEEITRLHRTNPWTL